MGLDEFSEMINNAMEIEVKEYGDDATQNFYKNLKNKKFVTTKCKDCGEVSLPPRMFCPECFETNIEWIDLPEKGSLFAFTQQERSLRFGKPDVIGVVELEGAGKLLTRIDAPYESLSIGDTMELDFIDISKEQTLHQFRPVK